MSDFVKPLKQETSTHGTEIDLFPTEVDPTEDYIWAKGFAVDNKTTLIEKDASNNLKFTDSVTGSKTLADLSSGSSVWSVDNIILIDPDEAEIAGKRYQSIANAITYVNNVSPSPSATNKYGIVFGGTNSENFTLPSYTYINGFGYNSKLTGAVTIPAITGSDYFEYVIFNCEISNLTLTNSSAVCALSGCYLLGATITNGSLYIMNSIINGGNYRSLSYLNIVRSIIFSGSFGNSSGSHYMNFCDISSATLYECTIQNSILSTSGISFDSSSDYYFSYSYIPYNLVASSGVTISARCVDFNNASLTVNSGGTLELKSCLNISSVTNNGGTFNITGDFYDNSSSGLTSSEVQGAIDELSTTSGNYWGDDNIVYVDPGAASEIAGHLYDDIPSAISWINSNGSPSSSNKWTIIVLNHCNDNFDAQQYITVQGLTKDVQLTGNVGSADTSHTAEPDIFEKYVIRNATITNLSGLDSSSSSIFLDNCIINLSSNPTAASKIFFKNCNFISGNISSVTTSFFISCYINSITSNSNAVYNHTVFSSTGSTQSIPGGSFENCILRQSKTFTSGTYYFYSCTFFTGITNNGATITTKGCTGGFTNTSGTWNNYGDNIKASGFSGILSSSDINTQTALETLDAHNHDDRYYTETELTNGTISLTLNNITSNGIVYTDTITEKTASNGITVSNQSTFSNGIIVNGGAVFNENSSDVDFRIESNSNTHCFFVDGGANGGGGIVSFGRSSLDNWSNVNSVLQFNGYSSIVDDSSLYFNICSNAYYNISNWKYSNSANASLYTQKYSDSGGHEFFVASSGTADENITWESLLSISYSNGIIFNNGGGDYDFRVEGDNNQNLLFCDAGNDNVGICTNSPIAELDVVGPDGVGEGDPTIGTNCITTFRNNGSSSDNCIISIISGTSAIARLSLGDKDGYDNGSIDYDNSSSKLYLGQSSGTKCIEIDNSNDLTVNGQMFYVGGSTTGSAANVYMNSTSGLFARSTSSIKYKSNIEDMEDEYSEKIYQMRPVWFRSKCEMDRKDWSHWGFIAEELSNIDPRYVHYNDNEEPEGVQYSRLVVPIIKEMKKLKQKNEEFEIRIAELEGNI